MVTTRGATSAAIQQFEYDAKNWKLCQHDFQLLSLLGQGGEGSVFHAKHIKSGMHVALKRIPFMNNWDNEQESRIHCQLQHPNILRMYGMFRDDENDDDNDDDDDSDDNNAATKSSSSSSSSCWIILEYCWEGTMMKVMETSDFSGFKYKKEAFVARVMHDILCAVQYMHQEHHLMHRDIKPINVLCKHGTAMLADFGMCASLEPKHSGGTGDGARTAGVGRNHEFVGTIIYMAPEVLAMEEKYRRVKTNNDKQQHGDGGTGSDNNKNEEEEWRKGYSFEADAWSVGITTYELLIGKHPFPIHDEQKYTQEVRGYVDNNFSPCAITFPDSVSSEAQDFILSLVQVDPKKRMSVDDALIHPWILRHNVKPATTTTMSNQDKENKPVKQQQQQRAAKGKQIVSSTSGVVVNDNAVKQVEALLGGLNINQV